MANGPKINDPHADREAARYDRPIPSRELIQEVINEQKRGLSFRQLFRALDLQDEEQEEALRRRVRAMLRDGQLAEAKGDRLTVAEAPAVITGTVQGQRDGYGFVLSDDPEGDIFLSNWQMKRVFDGDVVSVVISGYDRRGRREGRILEVLERNTRQVVGRYRSEHNLGYVMPDDPRIQHLVVIGKDERNNAEDGDYVMVEILQQPELDREPQGRVVEVIGAITQPGVATEVALRSHEIPFEWPREVEREARGFAAEPGDADKQGRVDLRQLPLVTIDGEDARDFDDAVYCEPRRGGGWQLWVAIADVSHYVRIGSALDEEAQLRGTSVYFPDRVVPMLPESLSNGLCSLKPDVDRLCMVCELSISRAGKMTGYRFYEGVMRSQARLTYNEVAALLEVEGADPAKDSGRFRHLLPQLKNLHSLYQALVAARAKRGAIDFDTVETRVLFDRQRRIEAIVPVTRNDAHKLIEECMLAANVATAQLLEHCELPALYRVHEGPTVEKLLSLRSYLGELGLDLGGGDKPTPEHYQRLIEQIEDRPDFPVIQVMLLRSLRQAVYQPENEGHFGLHYPAYTHFTSPIRRYPDLLVHRGIRWLIRSGHASEHLHREPEVKPLPRERIYPYDMGAMLAFGEHCSMTERRADDATRDVLAWLKCEFLEDRVGEDFDAVIAAVTGFGLFVELEGLYIEGLVHITALGQDYYQFDPARQRLIGERTRRSFQLGDRVRVRVLRVDVEERKIDLGLAEDAGAAGAPRPRRARGPRRDDARPAKPAAGRQERKSGKSTGKRRRR